MRGGGAGGGGGLYCHWWEIQVQKLIHRTETSVLALQIQIFHPVSLSSLRNVSPNIFFSNLPVRHPYRHPRASMLDARTAFPQKRTLGFC